MIFYHPGLLVDDAGDAGGDGTDLMQGDSGRGQHLFHHADDHLLNVFRLCALLGGLLFQPVDDVPILVEDGAQDFGPAHVQADTIAL